MGRFRNRSGTPPHLGVQRRVSVVSILQLVGHQPPDAVQRRIRTADLLQGSLDGVQNLLAGDGDEPEVGLVANHILAQLEKKQFYVSKHVGLNGEKRIASSVRRLGKNVLKNTQICSFKKMAPKYLAGDWKA